MTSKTSEMATPWLARYERNRDAYERLLAQDPFLDWDQNAMPEISVSMELIEALRIAYAKGPCHEQVLAFARRAALIAKRALDEDKLASPLSRSSFPLNRAVLYRDYSYARILQADRLDAEALRQASVDLEVWCKAYKKTEWNSQAQANYLSAVRISVLLGDLGRARELLSSGRSFRWHKDEHNLWAQLVAKNGNVRGDGRFVVSCNTYLERLCDPTFVADVYMETDIVRFEVATIADIYLISSDNAIDVARVVEGVAKVRVTSGSPPMALS